MYPRTLFPEMNPSASLGAENFSKSREAAFFLGFL